MMLPNAPADQRLVITTPGGDVQSWVRLEDFEAMQGAAFNMRRTLAMVHMHLSFGEQRAAWERLVGDTDLTLADARAMQGIVASVLADDPHLPTGSEATS